jgi:threonine synthase
MRPTLGEGQTPLLPSLRIAPLLGLRSLSFKLENTSPSGSYKDRFIAAEIARLLDARATACIATSSGNTGSALAAFCARYNLRCVILVNELAPAGKLAQMKAHGAVVLRVREFGGNAQATAQVFATLSDLAEQENLPLVVSAYRYCPIGMAGVESIGRELIAQTDTPHDVFVPAGSGGLYVATCRGIAGHGWKAHVVQPAGCSTVVAACESGATAITPVQSTTRISGLSVPFDIDASLALEHLRGCGGMGLTVDDEEVYESQRMLFQLEGILAEPAGATALAGLRKALREGRFDPDRPAICLVTGTGFKAPDSIVSAAASTEDLLIPHTALHDVLQRTAHV